MKKTILFVVAVIAGWLLAGVGQAADMEVLGVTFPGQKVIAGKTLTLNGVAYRKAFGIIKVYAVGLYLENPTQDANQVIESEQVKHLYFHYLTRKATVKRLQEGFIEAFVRCNPPELVERHHDEMMTYAGWLDKDMKPGLTSSSTYLPGQGITLEYQGEIKGTIPGAEFAQMYYRYNFGEKADRKIRQGLLGNR
jgi:hypothetical protein